MKQALSPFQPLLQRWQRLAPRTQRLLLMGTLLLMIGLFWATVWQPASRQRASALQRLPVLQQQLQLMRQQALEVQRLRNLPPTTNASINRNVADAESIQTLFGATAKVVRNQEGLRVQIPATAYVAFLDHLDQALARFRLRMGRLSMRAAADNTVSVDLLLVDPDAPRNVSGGKAEP
ncbi:MAG: type II secretion system protein M [Betaproteobacteria bacterium]|nr:type II secretion system protein M [Betaproteobacteria bacterium]